jgi:hypothetical protein
LADGSLGTQDRLRPVRECARGRSHLRWLPGLRVDVLLGLPGQMPSILRVSCALVLVHSMTRLILTLVTGLSSLRIVLILVRRIQLVRRILVVLLCCA